MIRDPLPRKPSGPDKIIKSLKALADPAKAKVLQGFFKTGPGQYGEGDIFWGVTVPQIRGLAKNHSTLPLENITGLLRSPVHEQRLFALILMVNRFEKGNQNIRTRVFKTYLRQTRYINNWDLVDLTAPQIVGGYLLDRDRALLVNLARSPSLWERRIAIVATHRFIREGNFEETFRVARVLLHDPHDLIHKAVGWMLREAGKRDPAGEESFLKTHYRGMPRTMLRYAIEKFPEKKRQAYLKGAV